MNRTTLAGVFLVLVAGVGAGYIAWQARRPEAAKICSACRRPVHDSSRTLATVGEQRQAFCCPSCALTAHLQTGRKMELLRLTDYETGAALPPDQAFLVRDSDENPCLHQHVLLDEVKHPAPVQSDRCSPSILAFAGRAAAERFIAKHGGVLIRFSELSASLQE